MVDLTKAFDKINKNILTAKLKMYVYYYVYIIYVSAAKFTVV